MNRRELLKSALLGGAYSLFSRTPLPAQMMGGIGMGMSASSGVELKPFQVELPAPPVLKPVLKRHPKTGQEFEFYEITAKQSTARILPDRDTEVWGYNGIFPGPTIVARQGHPVVLGCHNALPEETVVHLHGGHVPPESDGQMSDPMAPGGYQEYAYPNVQDASVLWYHPHPLHKTGHQVMRGMAGFYVLTDSLEENLPLPRGEYDVAFVIQDRLFNRDGLFSYPTSNHHVAMHGFAGDAILVNGALQPFLRVAARKYRFRVLNGSNARDYELRLSSGESFVQIGSDGGLLPAPVRRASIHIAPAERIEVVVDFSAHPVGSKIELLNALGDGTTAQILRFDVDRKAKDDSTVPAVLRPIQRLKPAEAAQTRRWVMGMNMMGGGMGMGGGTGSDMFTLNGMAHGHGRVDAYPMLGDIEIWEFVNTMPMMSHPMHCHAMMWQTLDVNGQPPAPWEAGWKDTWDVPPGGTVRIIGKWTDFCCDPNPKAHTDYMLHCHNLEHKDRGMMTAFRVLDRNQKPPAPGQPQEHKHG